MCPGHDKSTGLAGDSCSAWQVLGLHGLQEQVSAYHAKVSKDDPANGAPADTSQQEDIHLHGEAVYLGRRCDGQGCLPPHQEMVVSQARSPSS